ncbi:bifunctional metallophosphatase/5'-nucleotidase [Paenibacillus harenae]|uniref:bifunctional metallophosphatase/5'-nucleotidase n=1 Tax=Paenibacillus harenae TaxID=306543 RepID=UPI0003FE720B|nr:bifunctional metallophosphatase/5'-nucleotidase [Paenibacillus harenae]
MTQSNKYTYDILLTSDLHGAIRPVHYPTNAYSHTGLALLGALIRRMRERAPELLLVDNGDLLQGEPLAAYAAASQDNDKTHPFIEVLNELGYDAAVIGNHEFNYGPDMLTRAVQASNFPWLSANIVDAQSGEPAFGPPYIMKQTACGVKVALLGATTHYIPNWEKPQHIKGLRFLDALETIRTWVQHIRDKEQPDVVIVSYHGGFENDLATEQPAEPLTGENQAYAICREVAGIDVLLTGHQHRSLAEELHGVTIVQTGCNGSSAAHVAVQLEQQPDGQWQITSKQAELLYPEASDLPDTAVMVLTEELERHTQAWLDQPIGEIIGDLSIQSAAGLRLAAHPFMAFVHQVQMEATGAQLSNAALLSKESRGFGNKVTTRDVLANFIYPNTLTVLELSGQDIRDALEQTACYFSLDDQGEIRVNPSYMEPKAQHYNYDMWAGIDYELDISRPEGSRVVKLIREGEPLRMDSLYSVVMNSYRAAGGGNYSMFAGKPVLYTGDTDMALLAENYIRTHQPLDVPHTDNWKVTAG